MRMDECKELDSAKQKLLDLLAKESTMVLSTAYIYAKNYVNYGEDITKAWTTAVQQLSILDKVRQKAWREAYDSFKKDYENRLKDDLKAILVELQLEIEEKATELCDDGWWLTYNYLIQQKIDKLQESKQL